MKIEYYNFDSLSNHSWRMEDSQWASKNYKTKELALETANKNYVPSLNYSSIKFESCRIYGTQEVDDITYHSKKKNKDGTPKILSVGKKEISVCKQDFGPHSISEYDYLTLFNNGDWNGKLNDYKGYYKLKPGEITKFIEPEQNKITYKAQIFVKFFDVTRTVVCEIKKDGVPYRPPSKEIEEKECSDWLPVWIQKVSSTYGSTKWALAPSSFELNWGAKTELYFVEDTIYVDKHELEIEDE